MKKIIFFLLVFCNTFALAQKYDYVWVTGYYNSFPDLGNTDIDFNKNPPTTTYVTRDINFRWNDASICDEKGRFLFATNGCIIIGKNNKTIKNGTGLNPGKVSDAYCKNGNLQTQGSLFLPAFKDTSKYYLFHLGPEYIEKNDLGGIGLNLYYTLLDKAGDNGNGEVLSKNNLIVQDTFAFGIMTAVKHGNGRDWWIILPRMLQNKYMKLLFTPEKIHEPIYQNIGNVNEDDNGTGQAVFTPDGSKYIKFDRYNDLRIFDFDRCTGNLSNFKHIVLPIKNKADSLPFGGVAVSSNSRYLYATTLYKVFQYDLLAKPMENSIVKVAEYDNFTDTTTSGKWQTLFYLPHIAPNGKIYVNCATSVSFMHTIHEPDKAGLACNLIQHDFRLKSLNARSIPNFPNFRLGKLKNSACDTLTSSSDVDNTEKQIVLFPNPVKDDLKIGFSDNTLDKNSTFKAVVTNIYGQTVFTANRMYKNDAIDTRSFGNGVYMLTLYDENNQIIDTQRFVKQ